MHGFNNLGNTCYFNSTLQILLHIHEISGHIISNTYNGNCEFTKSYEHLVHMYFKTGGKTVFTTGPLLHSFVKIFPRFIIGQPHDSQDALFCIIDILEKGYPHIKDLVYGETTQITISPVSKNIIKLPFCIHILNMKKEIKDVNTMIQDSYKWNVIDDYIDNNGKQHNVATSRNIFSKYPKILFISFDKKSFVKINEELKLNDKIYELKSTIIHKGIQCGGHYMSISKLDNNWFIQDDETIEKLDNFPKEDNHFILVYNLKIPSY